MTKTPGTESSLARQILRFGAYVWNQSGRRATLALLFLVLGSLTEGASILLLVPILSMIGPGSDTIVIPTPGFMRSLTGLGITVGLATVLASLTVLVAIQALFTRFKSVYMAELLYDLVTRVRLSLFESIGRARWNFIARMRSSDIHHALTADIDRVQTAAFRSLLLVQGLVLLIVYLTVSWLISPAMTAFAVLSGVIVILALHPIRRRASAFGRLMTENRRAQYRTVTEFLGGLKVAKSFNAEPRYLDDLRSTLLRMRTDYSAFVRLNSYGSVAFQVSSAVALAIFVYVALKQFALPLPEIVVLIFVFLRLAPRFAGFQSDVQELLVNLPAFDAMRSLQAECEREVEETHGISAPPPELKNSIRLDGVAFRYAENAEDVLTGISFNVPARQITALIGPSGSGKTTIADLLMGLIEPTSGSILIDGVALDGQNRRRWRGSVAYVPQDVFLLHDTIAANLRLAAPAASEDLLWEALRAAQADRLVERLPDGLSTIVGDRGLRLSGGERQRVALARALVRKPQLLILDEATSALDWESQSAIAHAIERLRGSVTVLTIAHRPSMIAFADWVVAIEEGRVQEAGRYAELLESETSRLSRMVAGEETRTLPGPEGMASVASIR